LYTVAVKYTRRLRTFAPYMTRRSLEGFLFPATYEFTPETRAATLVANQLDAFAHRSIRGQKSVDSFHDTEIDRPPNRCLGEGIDLFELPTTPSPTATTAQARPASRGRARSPRLQAPLADAAVLHKPRKLLY
jgi:hypothetical protein